MTHSPPPDATPALSTDARPAAAAARALPTATADHGNRTAWVTLILTVLFTVFVWQHFNGQMATRVHERFLHRVEQEKNALLVRLQAYEHVLRGGVGLFAASTEVDRSAWRSYVDTLQFERFLPGTLGMGFAQMVSAADKEAYEDAVRAEGLADFHIHPAGERPLYGAITYLEPEQGPNLRALGFDMYADPVRRAAMNRARDSGQAALSGKVMLIQESGQNAQAGFLIYLPIYRPSMPVGSIAERRAALLGFSYSPFRAGDMFNAVLKGSPGLLRSHDVEFELYDSEIGAGNLLFDTRPQLRRAQHNVDTALEFGGQRWVARFHSSASFDAGNRDSQPLLTLLAGLLVNLLVFAVMYTHAGHQRRMRQAAARLAESHEEFRTLVENVPGVVFRSQLQPPRRMVHISGSIEALVGEAPERFGDGTVDFSDFIHRDDLARRDEAIATALDACTTYEVEYRLRDQRGRLRWVSERGRPHAAGSKDSPPWLDGVIVDITERRAAEAAIRTLAFVDPLTQLPNRRFLLDRLRQSLAISARSLRFGALLFVDMDNFKAVNDRFGHEGGDQLLTEVAARLRAGVREGDTVARLGGDEFIIMLENLGATEAEAATNAEHIANKILAALNQTYLFNGEPMHSTPSIGIAVYCGQSQTADELLRRADRAMYRAKALGRNQMQFHTQ